MSARGVEGALLEVLADRHDANVAAAQAVVDVTPGLDGDVLGGSLDQLVRGFEQLLTESLTGTSDTMRRIFLETAVPSLVARGVAPAALVQAASTFVTSLALELAGSVEPAHREGARIWLTRFAGEYARGVAEAAYPSEGP